MQKKFYPRKAECHFKFSEPLSPRSPLKAQHGGKLTLTNTSQETALIKALWGLICIHERDMEISFDRQISTFINEVNLFSKI